MSTSTLLWHIKAILSDYLYLAHRIDFHFAKESCAELSGNVLDVGCGRQPYATLFPDSCTYFGMEYNASLKPDIVGSVTAIPVKTETIDGVVCNEVLEHVAEPDLALSEISRVLKSGGVLYVTVPQCWGLHYEPYDFYRFTKYGLSYLLEKKGFKVIRMQQMGGLMSFFIVRTIDFLVLRVFFPIFGFLGITRGKYRISAILVLPINLLFLPITLIFDRYDKTNAYGWACLAQKIGETKPPF